MVAKSARSRRSRRNKAARRLILETLESRQLLAVGSFSDTSSELQSVSAADDSVAPGAQISVPVVYQTLDANGDPAPMLSSGLGLRLHYDSTKLSYDSLALNVTEDAFFNPNTLEAQDDASDFDGDPTTDKYLTTAWNDISQVDGGWPSASPLPATLYSATFTAAAGFATATDINFSASSTGTNASGIPFGFQGNSATILPPTLSIAPDDADQAEGDAGNTGFTFTVTRTGDTSGAASADYAITGSGGAAADAGDFAGALMGTVSFDPTETSQVITVNVNGDTDVELDEGFTVSLSSPVGATLGTSTATGTILNDDGAFYDPIFDVQVTNDIVYRADAPVGATTKELELDLYEPVGLGLPAELPAAILIHGGGFTGGDKGQQNFVDLANDFASRGYVTVSIDYRLLGDNVPDAPANPPLDQEPLYDTIIAGIEDTFHAIDWLKGMASDLNIDPTRIVLGGHSAGAFLSMYGGVLDASEMAGLTNLTLDVSGLGVAGILDMAGSVQGLEFAIDAGDPPVFIAHSTDDTVVPISNATDIETLLVNLSIPYEFPVITGAGHGLDSKLNTVIGGETVREQIFDFFHQQLALDTLDARTTGLFYNLPGTSDGYTLFSPNQTTSTYLMDKDGNIINEWVSAYPPGLHANMLEDGSLVRASVDPAGNSEITATGGGGLIERFDWDGNLVWTFDYNDDSTFADAVLQHHDFEVLPNGNILMIAWETYSATDAEQAGRDDTLPGGGNTLFPDHIAEVQPDLVAGVGGTIVWEWHATDHLVQDHDPTKDNYFGSTGVADHPELIDFNYSAAGTPGGGPADDWLHANGLDYNADLDQIVLSSREFSEFWIIDHSTTTAEAASHSGGDSGKGGDLLYRWGNPQTYDAGDASNRQLFYQHDPKWVEPGHPGAGNITVFNNGWGGPNLSSVLEIQTTVDGSGNYVLPPAGTPHAPASPAFSYTAPLEDYSQIISGTQRLANGNTLITFGGDGTFVEITPSQQEVWRYTNPYTGAGMLGPTDPIPGPVFVDLNTNFVFRATDYELDSTWSVGVTSPTIFEDAPGTTSVVYSLSGIVLENEQSSVQIDVQGEVAELSNFLQSVDSAASAYAGPGTLSFNTTTNVLTYTGGVDGTLMTDLDVPINPVNDNDFEYTESVDFVVLNPSSATGAGVNIDPGQSLSTVGILDDDGTALDRYVAKPDSSYAFTLNDTVVETGLTTYVIDMTSQTWRTAAEVDLPQWEHEVYIFVPDGVTSDTAILYIGSGDNGSSNQAIERANAETIALHTDQITIYLPTVPNQFLTFTDDGIARREDSILAYSFDKYLDGGDEEWPALLPMVKSAVRAMDTAQEFLANNTTHTSGDFFVTGGSKRGWTTYLTAAADPRVTAITPVVFDVVNTIPSLEFHQHVYDGVTQGTIEGYAETLQDYVNFDILDRIGTPEYDALMEMIDPYFYLDRLTQPKFAVLSTGDEFMPMAAQFYINDFQGPTYLRYIPNTSHSAGRTEGKGFFAAVDAGETLPVYDWSVEGANNNTIRLNSTTTPVEVNLWQATNLNSLDFRLQYFGANWTSTPLSDQGGGEYVGSVPVPASGGTAYMIEMKYNVGGEILTFTTEARIVEPDSTPPTVTDVIVAGVGGPFAWTPTFIDAVDGAGSDNGLGYSVLGAARTVPWFNVNTIYVQFSEDVNVASVDLYGADIADYAGNFSVSTTGSLTTITMTSPFGLLETDFGPATTGIDKLLLRLQSAAVTDLAGNALDGDGTGSAGGEFTQRFDVLPGDATGDGVVNNVDVGLTNLRGFLSTTIPGPNAFGFSYDAFFDLTADGAINNVDVGLTNFQGFDELPSGDPVPSSGGSGSPMDVNANGVISALDALMIINGLSANVGGENTASNGDTARGQVKGDVNGDGIASALDALLVINYLSKQTNSDRNDLNETKKFASLTDTAFAEIEEEELAEETLLF